MYLDIWLVYVFNIFIWFGVFLNVFGIVIGGLIVKFNIVLISKKFMRKMLNDWKFCLINCWVDWRVKSFGCRFGNFDNKLIVLLWFEKSVIYFEFENWLVWVEV